jgi:hypothetical protein
MGIIAMSTSPATDWRVRTAPDIGDLKAGMSSVNGKVDVIQGSLKTLELGIRDLVDGFRRLADKVESADKSLGEKIHAADKDLTGFQSEVRTLIRTAKWVGGILASLLTAGIIGTGTVLWAVRSETIELRGESRHHAERLARLDRLAEDVAVLKQSLAALPELTKSVGQLVKVSNEVPPGGQRWMTTVRPRLRHQDRYHLLLTTAELFPAKEGSLLIFKWPLLNTKDDWVRTELRLESASIPPGTVYSDKVKSVVPELVSSERRSDLRITLDFGDGKGADWARRELASGRPIPVEVVFDHNPLPPEPGVSDSSVDSPLPPPADHGPPGRGAGDSQPHS